MYRARDPDPSDLECIDYGLIRQISIGLLRLCCQNEDSKYLDSVDLLTMTIFPLLNPLISMLPKGRSPGEFIFNLFAKALLLSTFSSSGSCGGVRGFFVDGACTLAGCT